MFVLACKLTFYLPYSDCLKSKRRIRRQIVDRFQKQVIIKEVEHQEYHQSLTLGFCLIALREQQLRMMLEELIEQILELSPIELQEQVLELIQL